MRLEDWILNYFYQNGYTWDNVKELHEVTLTVTTNYTKKINNENKKEK